MPYGFDGYSQMQPGYFNTNYRPPMSAPVQQQQPQPMTNVNWIYVNGIGGARDHIVQPGQTAWMMDNNDPVIYVKAVDGMGSATLKGYRLTEIQAPAETPVQTEYATKEDLARIESRIEKLIGEIGGVNE